MTIHRNSHSFAYSISANNSSQVICLGFALSMVALIFELGMQILLGAWNSHDHRSTPLTTWSLSTSIIENLPSQRSISFAKPLCEKSETHAQRLPVLPVRSLPSVASGYEVEAARALLI